MLRLCGNIQVFSSTMVMEALTPRHRFRQLDPSWFLNGQTTSLLVSEAEKELVKVDFGGMA